MGDVTATSCISCRKKALLPDPAFPSNPTELGAVVYFQFLIILISLLAVLAFRNEIEVNGQVS